MSAECCGSSWSILGGTIPVLRVGSASCCRVHLGCELERPAGHDPALARWQRAVLPSTPRTQGRRVNESNARLPGWSRSGRHDLPYEASRALPTGPKIALYTRYRQNWGVWDTIWANIPHLGDGNGQFRPFSRRSRPPGAAGPLMNPLADPEVRHHPLSRAGATLAPSGWSGLEGPSRACARTRTTNTRDPHESGPVRRLQSGTPRVPSGDTRGDMDKLRRLQGFSAMKDPSALCLAAPPRPEVRGPGCAYP